MQSSYLHLDRILDIPKWQTLQDSLAEETGLAIITVDYKGTPVTRHSACRPFCDRVRGTGELEPHCRKCDSRGGLEAVRLNGPYIYLCHCDIVDLAIPIIIDDKYVGAVMAGQVRLPESDTGVALEQIFRSPVPARFATPELAALYANIPVLPFSRIQVVAQMLSQLCHYVVGEAMEKHLMLELYERAAHPGAAADPLPESYTPDMVSSIRRELSSVVANAYVKAEGESFIARNPVLQPVFDYMLSHKGEPVSQKQAAALCHMSTSHFSRLFTRETGEGFSSFMARQKVEWAKQLLEKTDLPISAISEELGFSEPGYFIKTFKRYENLTPATYRKYYQKKAKTHLFLGDEG